MQHNIGVDAKEAFKAAEDICGRLLDHRQFTSGEIPFVVKQLEEKRKECENVKLCKVSETLAGIKETDVHSENEAKLEDIATNVSDLLHNARMILDIEARAAEKRQVDLNSRREVWQKEIESIAEENSAKFKETDEYFASKEEDLKRFYQDLESKWNLPAADVKESNQV